MPPRGRRRSRRRVGMLPRSPYFEPVGPEPLRSVVLTLGEFEALRLVDYECMTQEEAAAEMGVSRRTLWNDLQSARKKLIGALIHGYSIRIEGGSYIVTAERG